MELRIDRHKYCPNKGHTFPGLIEAPTYFLKLLGKLRNAIEIKSNFSVILSASRFKQVEPICLTIVAIFSLPFNTTYFGWLKVTILFISCTKNTRQHVWICVRSDDTREPLFMRTALGCSFSAQRRFSIYRYRKMRWQFNLWMNFFDSVCVYLVSSTLHCRYVRGKTASTGSLSVSSVTEVKWSSQATATFRERKGKRQ